MKPFFILIYFIFICILHANSQQIISSTGKKINNASHSINFTIGEPVIFSSPLLGLGFHHAQFPEGYSISGTIYKADYITQVTSGKVFLIDYDTAIIQFTFIDSFDLNGTNGNYLFSNIVAGEYLILVKPNTGNYPNTVPTYYGDEALWQEATILNVNSDTIGINIAVQEMQALSGNGYLSGVIQYGLGSGKTSNGTVISFGDPVPGIDIFLDEFPAGIVKSHTKTNGSGFYSFANLPLNTNFKIQVDIPGLPMDSTYVVMVTSNDTIFTNLDFVVDTSSGGTGGIYIGYPLSVKEFQISDYKLHIYPNPAGRSFTVEIPNEKNKLQNLQLEIYDVKGRLIYQTQITSSKIEIPSENWTKGSYLVSLVEEGETVAKEKVVIE